MKKSVNFKIKQMSRVANNSSFEIECDGIKGVIVSANILFYNPNGDEFLLCKEMRKPTPQSIYKEEMTHVFGGKVEMSDQTPLYTAVREFVEELPFQLGGLSQEQTIIQLCQSILKTGVVRLKKDFCVSPRNRLYNRFYIINLDTLDTNMRNSILHSVYNWKPCANGIMNVYFWRRGTEISKPSSLLSGIISELPLTHFITF